MNADTATCSVCAADPRLRRRKTAPANRRAPERTRDHARHRCTAIRRPTGLPIPDRADRFRPEKPWLRRRIPGAWPTSNRPWPISQTPCTSSPFPMSDMTGTPFNSRTSSLRSGRRMPGAFSCAPTGTPDPGPRETLTGTGGAADPRRERRCERRRRSPPARQAPQGHRSPCSAWTWSCSTDEDYGRRGIRRIICSGHGTMPAPPRVTTVPGSASSWTWSATRSWRSRARGTRCGTRPTS